MGGVDGGWWIGGVRRRRGDDDDASGRVVGMDDDGVDGGEKVVGEVVEGV